VRAAPGTYLLAQEVTDRQLLAGLLNAHVNGEVRVHQPHFVPVALHHSRLSQNERQPQASQLSACPRSACPRYPPLRQRRAIVRMRARQDLDCWARLVGAGHPTAQPRSTSCSAAGSLTTSSLTAARAPPESPRPHAPFGAASAAANHLSQLRGSHQLSQPPAKRRTSPAASPHGAPKTEKFQHLCSSSSPGHSLNADMRAEIAPGQLPPSCC
jgi:hypothetical protein